MPPASRRSTAAPSSPTSSRPPRTPGSTATAPRATVPLPEYQPPAHPLTPEARDALQSLSREYPSAKLLGQYRDIQERMTDRAGEINEELLDIQTAAQKRRQKRDANADDDPDDDAENQARTDTERIEKMTTRMEAALRRAIDGAHAVDSLGAALREIQANAATAAAPPNTHTQTSRATLEPETHARPDSPSSAPPPPALVTQFNAALADRQDRYDAASLAGRYAEHNAYIGFKTHVHESRHGRDAPPLPHRSRWFAAAAPKPGETAPAENASDDDEVAIARETVSTKCPVTLRELADPLTSTRCPHSFEKAAILDLLGRAKPPGRERARPPAGWVPGVQCPVVGCEQRLTRADLEVSGVVVRRVRRVQRLNALRADMADEEQDDAARRGELIESGSEGGADVDMHDVDDAVGTGRAVKRERLRSTMEDIQDDGDGEGSDELTA